MNGIPIIEDLSKITDLNIGSAQINAYSAAGLDGTNVEKRIVDLIAETDDFTPLKSLSIEYLERIIEKARYRQISFAKCLKLASIAHDINEDYIPA